MNYLTGLREDGTVYSIYSFARKVGQAIAGGVGGFAIAAVGYIGSTKDTNTRDIRWNLYIGNISSWGYFSVSGFDINFLVSIEQVIVLAKMITDLAENRKKITVLTHLQKRQIANEN